MIRWMNRRLRFRRARLGLRTTTATTMTVMRVEKGQNDDDDDDGCVDTKPLASAPLSLSLYCRVFFSVSLAVSFLSAIITYNQWRTKRRPPGERRPVMFSADSIVDSPAFGFLSRPVDTCATRRWQRIQTRLPHKRSSLDSFSSLLIWVVTRLCVCVCVCVRVRSGVDEEFVERSTCLVTKIRSCHLAQTFRNAYTVPS